MGTVRLQLHTRTSHTCFARLPFYRKISLTAHLFRAACSDKNRDQSSNMRQLKILQMEQCNVTSEEQ